MIWCRTLLLFGEAWCLSLCLFIFHLKFYHLNFLATKFKYLSRVSLGKFQCKHLFVYVCIHTYICICLCVYLCVCLRVYYKTTDIFIRLSSGLKLTLWGQPILLMVALSKLDSFTMPFKWSHVPTLCVTRVCIKSYKEVGEIDENRLIWNGQKIQITQKYKSILGWVDLCR